MRNHPLPDGNKRAAFLLMLEALGRAGLTFVYLGATPDDVSEVIERLASRDLSEADFLVCSASTSPRRTRRRGSALVAAGLNGAQGGARSVSKNEKTPRYAGFRRYRHGDSNPGFRRERAAS